MTTVKAIKQKKMVFRLSEVKNCSLLRFGGFEAKLARKYPKSNSKIIFRTHHNQVIIINPLRLWSFLSSRL